MKTKQRSSHYQKNTQNITKYTKFNIPKYKSYLHGITHNCAGFITVNIQFLLTK